MADSYPNAIKTYTTKVDNIDDVMAEDVNDKGAEITAIETELGTLPKGAHATVKARLEAHVHSGGDGGQVDHNTTANLTVGDVHTQYHNDARGDARYALIAKGVTNGDSHDHIGGDGAQIDHGGQGGLADNDHPQYVLVGPPTELTTVHTTTILTDHIGEHTGSHGIVFDNIAEIQKTSVAGILKLDGGDNSTGTNNYVQIALGYNGTDDYPQFIRTRHNSAAVNNAIEFYTCDGAQNGVFPTNAILGLSIENTNILVAGNCSALSFTDRTPYPKSLEEAYAALRSVEAMDGKLNHEKLHKFIRRDVEISEKRIDKKTGEETTVKIGMEYERNISALVSVQTDILKDLISRVEKLEKQ